MRGAILLMAAVFVACSAAYAADETGQQAPTDPVVQELRTTDNPHFKAVEDRARALVAPLSQPEMQELYILRDGYGLIRSLEIVQRDIGRAARLCGEDNPDMKDKMDDRFKKWQAAVDPVLDEKMAALNEAVDKQGFAKPSQIRDYFKALDDAAIYAEKKFDKRVITSPNACESLLESMDESQDRVADLMKELRVRGPAPAEQAPEEDSAAE